MAYDNDGDSVVSNVESVVTAVESLQLVEFGRVVDEVDQVLEVESGQEKFDDEVDHTFGVKDLEEEVGDEVKEQEDEELVAEPPADSEFLSFFVLYSRLLADFLSHLGKWVKSNQV